jgi:hypothetical protein
MSRYFLIVFLIGCSDIDNATTETIKNSDPTIYFCGWQKVITKQLKYTDKCWLVTPDSTTSVVPLGGTSCTAEEGAHTSVWQSESWVEVWGKTFDRTEGTIDIPTQEVDCPIQ